MIPKAVNTPTGEATWGDCYNAVYYRACREPPRTKVAGFDMDGTLYRWTCANWPSNLNDYELWSERVLIKLRECHEAGYKVVIFGNRGQIKGAFGGKNAEKTRWLVNWLAREAGVPVHAVFATRKDDGKFSKPAIGMWAAMEKHTNGDVPCDPSLSFFVGDMAGRAGDLGRSDLEFAQGVGQSRGGRGDGFRDSRAMLWPKQRRRRRRRRRRQRRTRWH